MSIARSSSAVFSISFFFFTAFGLAASSIIPSTTMRSPGAAPADGTVAFVEPPAGAAPGERIVVEGITEDPASPNKVKKKKLMEKSAEELRAVDNVACYRGVPLSTSAGPCTSPVNGPIN